MSFYQCLKMYWLTAVHIGHERLTGLTVRLIVVQQGDECLWGCSSR